MPPAGVIVFGGIVLDIVLWCDAAPSTAVKRTARQIEIGPGGGAVNAAQVFSRLGLATRLVGTVGDDAEGTFVIDALTARGIDTAAIERVRGRTGRAVVVEDDGEVSVDAERAVSVSPISTLPERRVNDIVYCATSAPQMLDVAQAHARGHGFFALCPGGALLRAGDVGPLTGADLLCLNNAEARIVLGERAAALDDKALAGVLVAQGIKAALVTRGARGASFAAEGEAAHVAAAVAPVTSTLGAGDCFAATFVHFYTKGHEAAATMRMVTINSAAVLAKLTAGEGQLDEAELLRRGAAAA
jgi:ribokinase